MLERRILSYVLSVLFILSILEYYIDTNVFYYIILLVAGGWTLIRIAKDYKKYISNVNTLIFLSFFTSLIITGWENRYDIYGDWRHLVSYLVYTINAFLVYAISYYLYENDQESVNEVIGICSLVIFISAIVAYPEYIWHVFFRGEGFIYRVYSVLYNPIPASAIWLMGIWFPLYKKNKLYDLLLKLIYIPPIFFSQCRSVWLGVIFSALIFAIGYKEEIKQEIHNVNKKIMLLVAIFAATVSVLLIPVVIKVLGSRLLNITQGQGYYVRVNNYLYTIQQTFKSDLVRLIIGHGLNSTFDMIYYSPIYDGYPLCDNAYLTALYEEGVISILMIVAIMVLSSLLLRQKKITRINMALISSFVPSFFYDVQKIETPMFLIAVCAAIVCSSYYKEKVRDE